MLGGYNITPMVDLLDDVDELASLAADGLSHTLLMFDAFHDVNEKAKAGNKHAVRGTCDTCSKDICTAVTCDANKFNDDGNFNNGCELGCPTVADGTCDTCSDKDTCTAVTCDANF